MNVDWSWVQSVCSTFLPSEYQLLPLSSKAVRSKWMSCLEVSPILLFPTLVASTQLLRGTTRKHRHTESYPEHMPVKLPSFWVHTGRDAQSEYARIDKQPSEVWVLVLFGSTEDQTQYCSC